MRGSRHPSTPAVCYQTPVLSVTRGIHTDTYAITVETASQRRHVHPFSAFQITQVQRICLLVNVWLPFILLVVPDVILSVIIATASGTAACASGAEFVKQFPVAQGTGDKLYGAWLTVRKVGNRYRGYDAQIVLYRSRSQHLGVVKTVVMVRPASLFAYHHRSNARDLHILWQQRRLRCGHDVDVWPRCRCVSHRPNRQVATTQ